MTSSDVTPHSAVDLPETIRTEASKRLTRELQDVRRALTGYYDQAIARLDENQWVPRDLVVQLMNELSGETKAEQERGAALQVALELAQQEAETIRKECETTINAVRQGAVRDQQQTVARAEQEVNAAREAARAAEARLRAEIAAERKKFQEIVDAQMLQLVAFKREIEQEGSKTAGSRQAAAAPDRQASTRQTLVETPVVPISARSEERRRGEPPAFDAIEAALADSPPLGRWPSPPAV